jgi:hypothetical protein
MGGMRRWVPPAAVGGLLAWTALATPLSVGIGQFVAYHDPQSDLERLEYHRDLAAHVYTAGHWLGQLVAAFAGVWLVTRSGTYRWGTVIRTGAVLGLATATVAVVAGRGAMRTNGHPGLAADPTMLSEPSVRWTILVSLVCFPLWAVIGAALAGMTRKGALLAAFGTFLCQPATLLIWVGVLAPPSSHPLAVAAITGAGPAAMLMPAVLLGWAVAAVVLSLRLSRR